MLQEREAAAAARLLPAQMLNMGAGLLREARRGGFVSRAEARGFFRAEPQRSLRVLDALVGALPSSCPHRMRMSNGLFCPLHR